MRWTGSHAALAAVERHKGIVQHECPIRALSCSKLLLTYFEGTLPVLMNAEPQRLTNEEQLFLHWYRQHSGWQKKAIVLALNIPLLRGWILNHLGLDAFRL